MILTGGGSFLSEDFLWRRSTVSTLISRRGSSASGVGGSYFVGGGGLAHPE